MLPRAFPLVVALPWMYTTSGSEGRNMNALPDVPPSTRGLRQRVLSSPRTSLGKWSLGLVAAFVLLMCAFSAIIAGFGGVEEVRRFPMSKRTISFSNPHLWLSLTLFPAAISAIAGGITALGAIIKRAERSIFLTIPVFVAVLVLLVSIGEVGELMGR